jgi:hypothetical protein
MNRKILYIAAAILFILALISFRVGKETVNIRKQELKKPEAITTGLRQEQSKEPEIAAMDERQDFSPKKQPIAQSVPAAANKPGITIIKPIVKENSKSFSEDIENKSRQRDTDSFSSRSGLTAPKKESDVFSEEDATAGDSAITKVNKYPSESESKEMNERGIIMY